MSVLPFCAQMAERSLQQRSVPRRLPAVSPELLTRYDAALPRYTSYPTVPDWTSGVTPTDWLSHLGTLDASRDSLALYVHLPFCVARCLYCGCNATVTRRSDVVDRYLDRLEREIGIVQSAIGHRHRVDALHLGGGTPNFLSDAQQHRLMRLLRDAFIIDAGTECSVEADPRLVTPEQLQLLRRHGFTRISFGVQDLDAAVQRAIGRIQPEAMIRDVVQWARAAGFTGINLDLIYGLPAQTEDSFRQTVETALELQPDRIACFGYAHVPWMRPHQKRIDASTLPDAGTRFTLFRNAVEQCVGAGYDWIGIDHFARPSDPLAVAARTGVLHRNFMGYTTRVTEHVLGLGTSAISDVHGWLVQNPPELGEWQRALDAGSIEIARSHRRTEADVRHGDAIMTLMCNGVLSVGDADALLPHAAQQLAPFVSDGLLVQEPTQWRVTTLGQFFLRNISVLLDAYRAAPVSTARFSQAV
jgi:oxygen-independent coproporphyrinogen III oxidase